MDLASYIYNNFSNNLTPDVNTAETEMENQDDIIDINDDLIETPIEEKMEDKGDIIENQLIIELNSNVFNATKLFYLIRWKDKNRKLF